MRILFTPITSSSIAHMIRSFPLAEKLQLEGHKVYFTSCTSKKKFIEENGFEVVESYTPFNLNDDGDQSINYLVSHKKEMVEWFQADIRAAKRIKADVVISSPCLFGPHVTHATGIPTIALLNGQYLPKSKGLMGLSLANNTLRDTCLRTILKPIFEAQFVKKYLVEILDAYSILGINNNIKTREDLYKPMNILIPGDKEFEPQELLDNKTEYIGPIFWEGFENMKGSLTEKEILEFKGDDKLVFVTFGGSVFSRDVYNRVISRLNKIEAKVIVALGPNFDRKEFPKDSSRILIRRFVPGLRLSRLSDVIVNTGSHGAIMQALVNGKPVVAFPVGIDQAYFANRLEEMQVGINVNKISILGFSKRESYQFSNNDIPESMVIAVNKLLLDESYSRNAQNYAQRMKNRYSDPRLRVTELISNIVKGL